MAAEGRDNRDELIIILCLRALMNNALGFSSVMRHPDTINHICFCLSNVDPFKVCDCPRRPNRHMSQSGTDEQRSKVHRTHVLVLELLAAVCLVPKGHPRILEAFDHYKEACRTRHVKPSLTVAQTFNAKSRFQNLMHILRSERANIHVIVACMAFINVVVHCVPDMNFQARPQRSAAPAHGAAGRAAARIYAAGPAESH